MIDIAVQANKIGKKYDIHEGRASYHTFREALTNFARSPLRRNFVQTFWALKDVSFDIEKGEVVGIIGRNGAGKSTLLKILSKITEPSEGKAVICGRVGSLLEVGTGFHPELTGRENIFLSGAILGMRKYEIDRQFDEIVKFAETEKFLDTPLKHYSSGMQVRLGFAVAAHLDTDVLMVDEVLSVGDMAFQKKSMKKMENISCEGRTILFVSHNLGAIENLCSTCILMENGHSRKFESVKEGIYEYLRDRNQESVAKLSPSNFLSNIKSSIEFLSVEMNNPHGKPVKIISPSEKIAFSIKARVHKAIPNFRTTFSIFNSGIRLFSIHDTNAGDTILPGEYEYCVELPEYFLRPGNYSVAIGGHREGSTEYIWGTDLLSFDVLEEWDEHNLSHNYGVINLDSYIFNRYRTN